jgi:hypothetical protein
MTNSRSKASTSKVLAILVVLGAVTDLGGLDGVAHADKKRVVVVLDFEGPKGERFHDELVRLVKTAHTVLPTDKWNGVAEELDAGSVSARDIKRVARKLKVDAVVEGRIEKRRNQFIIRLRLHDGRSGDLVGSSIDTKAEGPRLDKKVERELKDELFGAIDSVEPSRAAGDDDDDGDRPVRRGFARRDDDERGSARVGDARKRRGAEDDEDRPSKKRRKQLADDDEDRPSKKARKQLADDDEDRPSKRGNKRLADGDDDEDRPSKQPGGKKLAAADDRSSKKPGAKKLAAPDVEELPVKKPARLLADDRSAANQPAAPLGTTPGKRDEADDEGPKPRRPQVASRPDDADQVDADPSMSQDTRRTLSPADRALEVVAGMSITQRTLTFTSSSDLMMKPPGYNGIPVAGAMLDATLYPLALGHERTGLVSNLGVTLMLDRVLKISSKNRAGTEFDTLESRYGVGAVFRYPLGHTAMAPVVLGTLGYASQIFRISNTDQADVPSVRYSIFEPGLGLRYPVTPHVIIGADVKLMLIPTTGQIQEASQYGAASVYGFEGALAADYLVTSNLFVRAAGRFETIGFSFAGNGTQTNTRDGQPDTQDVQRARDNYFGGFVTVGYLY